MRRTDSSAGGFSLMEVTTALGITSFALVALLGVFPLGLDNSRASVNETRAAQLSKMVYSTLATEISSAPVQVRCFSDSLTPLSLDPDGKVYNDGDTIPEVAAVLYASYDVTEQPKLTRAATAPTGAIYTLDLLFRPRTFSFSETTSTNPTVKSKKRVIGYDVRVAFRGLRKDKANEKPFFQTSSFVPSFQRAAYAK
jgi:uncharacterized protein (TIGR02598 family)